MCGGSNGVWTTFIENSTQPTFQGTIYLNNFNTDVNSTLSSQRMIIGNGMPGSLYTTLNSGTNSYLFPTNGGTVTGTLTTWAMATITAPRSSHR